MATKGEALATTEIPNGRAESGSPKTQQQAQEATSEPEQVLCDLGL